MSSYIYEHRGRKLIVEFVCGRCGAKVQEDASKQDWLRNYTVGVYNPPEGWYEESNRFNLLCPDCAAKLKRFLDGEGDVV